MTDTIDFPEQDGVGMQARRDRARAAFLIHLVAMATEVPPQMIARVTRAQSEGARARWVAIYLMHITLSVPLRRVAAAFGRDRTTVSQVVRRIEDWRSDPVFDLALAQLEQCAAAAPLEAAPEILAGERRPAERGAPA